MWETAPLLFFHKGHGFDFIRNQSEVDWNDKYFQDKLTIVFQLFNF